MKLITDDGTELTIEQVKSADLGDGDVVILRTENCISRDANDHLVHAMNRLFPNNKGVVFEENTDLEILRTTKHLYCPSCGDEFFLKGGKIVPSWEED